MAKPRITAPLTGDAIREYLLRVGVGHPHGFYSEFKRMKPTTSYGSVRRYFYILREIGLVERVGTAPGRGRWPRSLYRIVPGMEDDPRWGRPQVELYPSTRWGARRYARALAEGKVVPGRRERYAKL